MLLYIPFPLRAGLHHFLETPVSQKTKSFLESFGIYIAENNKMVRLVKFMEVFFLLKEILKNKQNPDFQYSIEMQLQNCPLLDGDESSCSKTCLSLKVYECNLCRVKTPQYY